MIIGISGKIGTGKDTTAHIIRHLLYKKKYPEKNLEEVPNYFLDGSPTHDFLNYSGFELKRFAQKLKQICALLTGCQESDFESQEFKNKQLYSDWLRYEYATTSQLMRTYFDEGGDILGYAKEMGWKCIQPISPDEKEEAKWERLIKQEYTYRELLQRVGTEAMRGVIHDNIWINALFSDYKSKFREKDGMIHTKILDENQNPTGEEVIWKDNPLFEPSHFPNWIITDVRFPNEAKAIKERGGILIRVNKDWEKRMRAKLEEELEDGAYEIGTAPNYAVTGKGGYINFNVLLYKESLKSAPPEHSSENSLDDYDGFDYIIDNSESPQKLVQKVKEILIELKLL